MPVRQQFRILPGQDRQGKTVSGAGAYTLVNPKGRMNSQKLLVHYLCCRPAAALCGSPPNMSFTLLLITKE
jgi:hypothetical protein